MNKINVFWKNASGKNELTVSCKLIFSYGIMQSISAILQTVNLFLIQKPYWNFRLGLIFDLLFLIYFMKLYIQHRNTAETKYFNGVYAWGILAGMLPFIMLTARLLIFLINADIANQGMAILADNQEALEILLFCWMVMMTGLIMDIKWMSPLAVLLILFLLICNVFIKLGISANALSLLLIFTKTFGYIVLGYIFYILRKSVNCSEQ